MDNTKNLEICNCYENKNEDNVIDFCNICKLEMVRTVDNNNDIYYTCKNCGKINRLPKMYEEFMEKKLGRELYGKEKNKLTIKALKILTVIIILLLTISAFYTEELLNKIGILIIAFSLIFNISKTSD